MRNKDINRTVKCSSCGEFVSAQRVNGVYRKGGLRYYCHDKECQERFHEDAGEQPDYDEP